MTETPMFSIVVTTFNRSRIVTQCVESCLAQTDPDFELIVVDDASTDDTVPALSTRFGDRVRIVRHDANRGINPARNSGVAAARGRWVVVVDSDWELLPESLSRLRAAIDARPPGVRAVRSLLRWDDGTISPPDVPAGVITYTERIRWLERLSGRRTDAGRCFERALLEEVPYVTDRRGAMEMLWELRVARRADAICVDEVLGLEHETTDSHLRSSSRSELIPRLIAEAPDTRWMAETTLREHGPALREHGPRQYALALRMAAQQSFLCGDRRAGIRFGVAALRSRPGDLTAWAVVLLGSLGARPLAYGVLADRLRAAR